MKFYLGTHKPHWLGEIDIPLFVSHRQLYKRQSLPKARGGWALDSGGFTELSSFGRWTFGPEDYVDAVRRYRDEIGGLEWAAPMDWMCEPMIRNNTGETVEAHQYNTVKNFLLLREIAPDLPFIPVLQGWQIDDFHRCIDLYTDHGIDLWSEIPVGVGSICRRQATGEIAAIIGSLAALGLHLHGFGVKTSGLRRYGADLHSIDSMAWSFGARYNPPLPGHSHKSCANCLEYALKWRMSLLNGKHSRQPHLI